MRLDSVRPLGKIALGDAPIIGVEGMPFLEPHFEYDVFVSYSHGAQASATESPLQDWTLELVRQLDTDIRFVDNEFATLHIWRDEHIDPTTGVPDEPVVAYVRDAQRGEVTVSAGTTEHTYRDRALVQKLLRAAKKGA